MNVHTIHTLRIASVLAVAVACALNQVQAAPIAYPAKGQSPAQQQSDDGECYIWAKGNTGIDPAAVATAPAPASPAPAPAAPGGERVAGALRGAAVGGIIDGGEGAAKGAAVGVVAGGARAQKNKQTQQAQQQQAQQAQQASAQSSKQATIDTFYRAHSACMEARGYTVK
jgi:hypothetical protein